VVPCGGKGAGDRLWVLGRAPDCASKRQCSERTEPTEGRQKALGLSFVKSPRHSLLSTLTPAPIPAIITRSLSILEDTALALCASHPSRPARLILTVARRNVFLPGAHSVGSRHCTGRGFARDVSRVLDADFS
jgi:hypothetical protein